MKRNAGFTEPMYINGMYQTKSGKTSKYVIRIYGESRITDVYTSDYRDLLNRSRLAALAGHPVDVYGYQGKKIASC